MPRGPGRSQTESRESVVSEHRTMTDGLSGGSFLHIPHHEHSPRTTPGGAVHLLRTGSPSTHPHGPLSWPCTRAQRTELDVTAGASSQGTDSEPWPPGLLLGVKLHTGVEHPELEGEGVRSSSVPTVFPETEDGRSPQSPLHAPLLLPSFMTFLPILGPSLSTDLYC